MYSINVDSLKSIEKLNKSLDSLNKLSAKATYSAVVAAEKEANKAAQSVNEDIRALVYSSLLAGGREKVIASILDAGGTIPAVAVKRDKSGVYGKEVRPVCFNLFDMENKRKAVYAAAPGWASAACAVGWRVLRDVANKLAPADKDNKLVSAIPVSKTTKAALKDGDGALSNRALLAALQKVVDMIYFEAGDNGENIHKVRTQDARFFAECLTKEGRGMNTVAMANDATIRRLIWKVVVNVVTKAGYDIDK